MHRPVPGIPLAELIHSLLTHVVAARIPRSRRAAGRIGVRLRSPGGKGGRGADKEDRRWSAVLESADGPAVGVPCGRDLSPGCSTSVSSRERDTLALVPEAGF